MQRQIADKLDAEAAQLREWVRSLRDLRDETTPLKALRSQLADAALAWVSADRALEAAIRGARVHHPGFDASMADPSVRAALDAYDAPEALMAELAAKIEALK